MKVMDELPRRLAGLNPQVLECRDDSAAHAGHAGNRGGGHYHLVIVSEAFVGQSRLARQRMVQAPLADLYSQHIHALSIQAFAPDEYFA